MTFSFLGFVIQTVVKNIQSDYSSFAPVELNEINYFSEGGFYNSLKDPDRITKLKAGRGKKWKI